MYNGIILITFRALTHAQRGAKILNANGCAASVTRPPQKLLSNQCGYAVKIHESCLVAAVKLLRETGLFSGRVFRKIEGRDGEYEVIDSV